AKAFVLGTQDPVPLRGGTTNGQVHIEVPAVGSFTIKMRAPPDLFTSVGGASELAGVQVDYEYKSDQDPDHVAGSIVLRKDDTDGQTVPFSTGRAIEGPVILKPTYLRKQAASLAGTPQRVYVRAGQQSLVEVPSPWRDALQIVARVPPGVPGLKKVEVELHYADPANSFNRSATISIDDSTDWSAKTNLVQSNKDIQKFKYRYNVQGADQLSFGPWLDAEGDQELVLPVLAVRLRLDRLKLGTTYSAANLKMLYEDAAHNFRNSQEIFVDKSSQNVVWLVPRRDPNLEKYPYAMTLFTDSGKDADVDGLQGEGTTLFLPPPPAPPQS